MQPGRGFLPDVADVSSPGASPLPIGFGRARPAPASRLSLSPPQNSAADRVVFASPVKTDGGLDASTAEPDMPAAAAKDAGSAAQSNSTGAAGKESESLLNQGAASPARETTDGPSSAEAPVLTLSSDAAVASELSEIAELNGTKADIDIADGEKFSPEQSSKAADVGNAAEATTADRDAGVTVKIQGLELDRSSEPAAMAAARSGSLPGPARPGSDDAAAAADPAAEPIPASQEASNQV